MVGVTSASVEVNANDESERDEQEEKLSRSFQRVWMRRRDLDRNQRVRITVDDGGLWESPIDRLTELFGPYVGVWS